MGGDGKHKPSPSMKKRPGIWQFLRAALFMVRRCVGPKPKVVEKRMLKNLVGAMRPLHHNIDQGPAIEQHGLKQKQQTLHGVSVQPPPPLPRTDDEDDDDDMISVEPESRYASADNLLELDDSQGESSGQPNVIDMKAEEFIAKFYEQIRLQRLDSINRSDEMMESASG